MRTQDMRDATRPLMGSSVARCGIGDVGDGRHRHHVRASGEGITGLSVQRLIAMRHLCSHACRGRRRASGWNKERRRLSLPIEREWEHLNGMRPDSRHGRELSTAYYTSNTIHLQSLNLLVSPYHDPLAPWPLELGGGDGRVAPTPLPRSEPRVVRCGFLLSSFADVASQETATSVAFLLAAHRISSEAHLTLASSSKGCGIGASCRGTRSGRQTSPGYLLITVADQKHLLGPTERARSCAKGLHARWKHAEHPIQQ